MKFYARFASVACATLMGLALAAGCDKKDAQTQPPPAAPKAADAKPAAPAAQPLIPVAMDWCREHAMPESICVQCNDSLVAAFQAKKDWCKEHKRPESQCFECHPELKEQFAAAFKQKYGKEPPAMDPEKK